MMANFVELIPFTFKDKDESGVKAPIIINVDCIKAVSKDETTLAKVLVSDEVKGFFEEQITDNEFIYAIEPTYEELAKILTQKEVREQNNMNE
jgi:hypothetical protein